jgi:hypothetical protein
MGWEPRRGGRRNQARDVPGDPGSARGVPSRGAPRDSPHGSPWPEEEHRRRQSAEESQSAEEWLQAFRVPQEGRPAATVSSPSRSRSRHPEAGQPPNTGLAVPPGSGRTAGYPAERYGRSRAGGQERGNGGASGPGEGFVRQRPSAEQPAARRIARPEAPPVQPRTPGLPGAGSPAAASEAYRPDRAGTAAPGPHTTSQASAGRVMRQPMELGRGVSQRRGPGPPPQADPRTALVPDERGPRGPEPGRAPSPGRHARTDPDAQRVRRPDEGARVRQDAAGATGSPHPAAAGARARESRMPPANRLNAPAQPPVPDRSRWVGRHAPHPAPSRPATTGTSPDDETVPLPVILGDRPAGRTAAIDRTAANGRDAVAREGPARQRAGGPTAASGRGAVVPERPASRRADGPRHGGSGSRRSPLAQKQAKLDQIEALYRTAGAIGEEALTRHFDQLSQRQYELIREYFEQAGLGRTGGSRGISAADPAPWVSARSTPFLPPH